MKIKSYRRNIKKRQRKNKIAKNKDLQKKYKCQVGRKNHKTNEKKEIQKKYENKREI